MKASILIVFIFLLCVCLAYVTGDQHDKKFSATSEFAFNFYKKLATSTEDSKNIIFSPLSIYVAFAMLKVGARQNTEHEMDEVLKWQQLMEGSSAVDGHEAVKSLLSEVFAPLEKNNTISIANKLWIQKHFCAISCDDFISKLQKYYDSAMGELNFVREAEKSRQEINKWVEDKTNNKIKDLFPHGSISSLTRFVLTNAIYFKGKWKKPFKKKHTSMRDFNTFNGKDGSKVKKVPTMYQSARVNAYGLIPGSEYHLVDLPYESEQLSMLIILPPKLDDFHALEKSLSTAKLNKMLGKLYRYPSMRFEIYLPKFKMKTSLKLKSTLQKLGMKDVFDQSKADLSGITGFKGMHVSTALHKAFISVDEEGTEATASTGISAGFLSLPPNFKVNKPFIFMIRHNPTGTILFMGRIMDPTLEE